MSEPVLTEQRRQIVLLIERGLTKAEIAVEIDIHRKTLDEICGNMRRRYGVRYTEDLPLAVRIAHGSRAVDEGGGPADDPPGAWENLLARHDAEV